MKIRCVLMSVVALGVAFDAVACTLTNREPPVNFQDITTHKELYAYADRLANEYSDLNVGPYFDCVEEEGHASRRHLGDDFDSPEWKASVARDKALMQRGIDATANFRRRVEQAGDGHLALLKSQPVPGSYTGAGMASTGTAKSNRAPTSSSARTQVSSTSSSSGSSGTSSNGGSSVQPAGTYQAWHCIQISNVDSVSGQTKQLRNTCAFDVEAYWKDPRGGWSQAPMASGDTRHAYSGAVLAMACSPKHRLDKSREVCRP